MTAGLTSVFAFIRTNSRTARRMRRQNAKVSAKMRADRTVTREFLFTLTAFQSLRIVSDRVIRGEVTKKEKNRLQENDKTTRKSEVTKKLGMQGGHQHTIRKRIRNKTNGTVIRAAALSSRGKEKILAFFPGSFRLHATLTTCLSSLSC